VNWSILCVWLAKILVFKPLSGDQRQLGQLGNVSVLSVCAFMRVWSYAKSLLARY